MGPCGSLFHVTRGDWDLSVALVDKVADLPLLAPSLCVVCNLAARALSACVAAAVTEAEEEPEVDAGKSKRLPLAGPPVGPPRRRPLEAWRGLPLDEGTAAAEAAVCVVAVERSMRKWMMFLLVENFVGPPLPPPLPTTTTPPPGAGGAAEEEEAEAELAEAAAPVAISLRLDVNNSWAVLLEVPLTLGVWSGGKALCG